MLVDNIEHGRALNRLLGWPVYSLAELPEILSADTVQYVDQCRIETVQHAAKHKLPVEVISDFNDTQDLF